MISAQTGSARSLLNAPRYSSKPKRQCFLKNFQVPIKVNAAIENAKTLVGIQNEYGSFVKWLEHHHPKSKEEWVKLFKKTFKFTGGEIVNEFLMSIGYLQGAHSTNCKIYSDVLKTKPMWLKQ